MMLQKVFPTFCASLPFSVKPEMFGNRFELGFSGGVFDPMQHVTVRTDCRNIVRFDVTYDGPPMSHEMVPKRPREQQQPQQQQQQQHPGPGGAIKHLVCILSFGRQLYLHCAWDLACRCGPVRERGPSTMLFSWRLTDRTIGTCFSIRRIKLYMA